MPAAEHAEAQLKLDAVVEAHADVWSADAIVIPEERAELEAAQVSAEALEMEAEQVVEEYARQREDQWTVGVEGLLKRARGYLRDARKA